MNRPCHFLYLDLLLQQNPLEKADGTLVGIDTTGGKEALKETKYIYTNICKKGTDDFLLQGEN